MAEPAEQYRPASSTSSGQNREDGADVPKLFCEGDHSTDMMFDVEGKRLHFTKALLAVCSPVFSRLLTPEYIQQHPVGMPLPGKRYDDVVSFLLQIHPVYSSVTPVKDDVLLELLALASQYQVEHIRTKCEQYFSTQLQLHQYQKMLTKDMVLLYLTACEKYSLAQHRDRLVQMAAENSTEDLQQSALTEAVPPPALRDVFRVRCQTLEQQKSSLEGKVSSLEQQKSGLEGKVSSLEQQKSGLEGKVSSLEQQKSGLEGKVSLLESNVSSLERQKRNLETERNGLYSQVDDLKRRLHQIR